MDQKPQLETTTKIVSTDDAEKLGIPTSLEDIFSFGEEGVQIAGVIDKIIGGDQRDDFKVIQRTNLSKKEASETPRAIMLAKNGINDILGIETPDNHWELPWLKADIIYHLRACTSVDFHSIEKAVEALQSFKLKTEIQKTQKLNET